MITLKPASARQAQPFFRCEAHRSQQFGDLHRIQRRALAEIVGHAPQHQAVLDGRVSRTRLTKVALIADAFDRA
jgi:hypothetical protein